MGENYYADLINMYSEGIKKGLLSFFEIILNVLIIPYLPYIIALALSIGIYFVIKNKISEWLFKVIR